MTRRKELSLDALLAARDSGKAITTADTGDAALVAGRFDEAAQAYARRRTPSEYARAKHGFVLGGLGEYKAAIALLTIDNVGTHPSARAMLAWVLYYGEEDTSSTVHPHADTSKRLLQELIDEGALNRYGYWVLLQLWFKVGFSGRPLAVAEAACQTYPRFASALGVLARERRVAGNHDPTILEQLREVLEPPFAAVLEQTYQWALTLGDWALAHHVLERVRGSMEATGPITAHEAPQLALLSAYVLYMEGRAGRTDALQESWALLNPWLQDGGDGHALSWATHDAARLCVCIATEINDPALIVQACHCLIDWMYDPDHAFTSPLDTIFVRFDAGLEEDLTVVLDTPVFGHNQRVLPLLDTGRRVEWELLSACTAVICGTDTEKDRDTIINDGPLFGPRSELNSMIGVLMDGDPLDTSSVGTLLARFSVLAEDRPADEALRRDLGYMTPQLSSLDASQIREVFESMFLAMDEQEVGTGEIALRTWGVLMRDGAPHVLTSFAKRFQERTGQQAPLPPPADPVQRALARFPALDACPDEPAALSLLQSASLVALLRAELDHSRWILQPLERMAAPFEPHAGGCSRRFIATLFDLAQLGIVGFSRSTPKGVLGERDGNLTAYLDRVVWSVSPRTLALYRAVRDLPRAQWPAEWRESAPMLARDLGAQELMAYACHLCEQRSLVAPDENEVLPVFKHLLEHRSVAHGYYLVSKTVRETVDYQAKYNAGQQQTLTRLHKLLRGNVERSLQNGWDTRYHRDRDVPASLLFEALHDVLTGWGSRAFDEPVFSLPLTANGVTNSS